MNTLNIVNLHVKVEEKEILNGVNLKINSNETLALLGPNGHGKSTLFAAIMGNPRYEITSGNIYFNDVDITSFSPDERSKLGLFLGFQAPYEIPGLLSMDFYRGILNAHSETKIKLGDFYKKLKDACDKVNLPFDMVNRNFNDGFSGGEKKRNEILQMILLSPKFCLLDEIDSGLDVDAINTVSNCINNLKKENGSAFLIISHYARLFELVHPDRSAVMINGKIVADGDYNLVKDIDEKGYEWLAKKLDISIKKEETSNKKKVSIGTCAIKENK